MHQIRVSGGEAGNLYFTPPVILMQLYLEKGFPGNSDGKESAAMRETRVPSQEGEDPLEKGMATHSTILAQRILPREKPGRLQSMESQRIGHD